MGCGCLGLAGAETGSGATRRVVGDDRSEAEVLDAVEHRSMIIGLEVMPGRSWWSPQGGRGAGVSGSRSLREGAASPRVSGAFGIPSSAPADASLV